MAVVKRKTLDRFNESLRRISDQRGAQMFEAVMKLDLTNPAAADFDAAVLALRTVAGAATAQTELVAGSLYNGVRFDALGQISDVFPQATRNTEAVDRAARGIIEKYSQAGETQEQIANRLAARVSYEVKRAAASTIYNMGKGEPRRLRDALRYARVPSGNETCDFCLMLASRGAVYINATTAGQNGNHYHADCDCVIVPMWDTQVIGRGRRSYPTTVEGYDPDALYERYKQSELGKRYQLKAAQDAGKVSEKAAKEWSEGIEAAAAAGAEPYKVTKSEQRIIYETLRDSEYGHLLDLDYESLLKGSYMTENEEARRAYHTALAFVNPKWKKNKATGEWFVESETPNIPD